MHVFSDPLKELASAALLEQRSKSGVSTSVPVSPAEEKIAFSRAGRILKVIHLSIMNRTLQPQADPAEVEALIAKHRNASVVNLPGLLEELAQANAQTYLRDLGTKSPLAHPIYEHSKRRVAEALAFQGPAMATAPGVPAAPKVPFTPVGRDLTPLQDELAESILAGKVPGIRDKQAASQLAGRVIDFGAGVD